MKSIFSVFSVLLTATLALGVAADKNDEQKAAAAFQKGIDAYKKGNMDAAVTAFRRADALKPSWKIQYNIGQCEAAARRYGLAIEAFEQYLGQGGDEVPKERQEEVLKELDRMRRMVGTIVIKGQPGVDVYVDIVKHGNTSLRPSIQVTAGVEHEISFVKDGKKLGSVNLIVSGGEVVELPMDSKDASTVSVAPIGSVPPVDPIAQKEPVNNPAYNNMRQIKDALRAKTITRVQYQNYQKEIQAKRKVEYDGLKADLRAKKITERDYKEKIAACRKKYEGD